MQIKPLALPRNAYTILLEEGQEALAKYLPRDVNVSSIRPGYRSTRKTFTFGVEVTLSRTDENKNTYSQSFLVPTQQMPRETSHYTPHQGSREKARRVAQRLGHRSGIGAGFFPSKLDARYSYPGFFKLNAIIPAEAK